MATDTIEIPPTAEWVSKQPGGINPARLHYPPFDLAAVRTPCGYLPTNLLAELFGKNMFPLVGGGHPYAAGEWTTTFAAGGTATDAAVAGGGILLSCPNAGLFECNLESKQAWTPVAGKRGIILARAIVSSITTVGFELNFGSSQVDPAGTDYTDAIGLKQAVGGGAIIGKVRGNSGTVSNTATLQTASAAVEFFVGLDFLLNATDTSCQGGFFYGTSIMSYTYLAFSAGQKTQAAAILTTPPSMFLNLHAKGSTGVTPTVQFVSVVACIDN